MDLSNVSINASAAEKSKMPDRAHVVEKKGIGELTQSNPAMVTVQVGPDKVTWSLHEAVICNASKYFKDAFRGGFAEASSKIMHLTEDDPDVFKKFVDYIYRPGPHNATQTWPTCYSASREFCKDVLTWFALEVFADKIGLNELRNYAVGGWRDCCYNRASGLLESTSSYRPLPEQIRFVFENCSMNSQFRSILVDQTVMDFLSWQSADSRDWGELIASNVEFAKTVYRGIKAHMDHAKEACEIWDCCVHRPEPSSDEDDGGDGQDD